MIQFFFKSCFTFSCEKNTDGATQSFAKWRFADLRIKPLERFMSQNVDEIKCFCYLNRTFVGDVLLPRESSPENSHFGCRVSRADARPSGPRGSRRSNSWSRDRAEHLLVHFGLQQPLRQPDKMTKLQFLNVFLTERLMLAAQEIYKSVEDTILEYQEEIAIRERENDHLRRKLRDAGIEIWPG